MITKLTEKLQGWSQDKLAEYTNNAKLPAFEDKSTFIQEYDDRGLFVYNQQYVKYYGNDGKVMSLSKIFTTQDPEIYTMLYNKSVETKFKFYKLIKHDYVTIKEQSFMYLEFDSPFNNLGIPFFAFDKLTTDEIVFWIEQVEFMIVVLKEYNYLFPNDAINLNKLIKDEDSTLTALCPIFGPNNWCFSYTCEKFINEQLRRLVLHKQLITVDTGEAKPVYIDWNIVKEKSKIHWLVHKRK